MKFSRMTKLFIQPNLSIKEALRQLDKSGESSKTTHGSEESVDSLLNSSLEISVFIVLPRESTIESAI